MTTNPADLPLGALLRDPVSGRWAVRFQVDDTTGKGMHAWLSPATEAHPDVRVLHHVEVRGWAPPELPVGVARNVRALLEWQASELAEVRASREAWAIEADRLDVIATAARYYVQPDTCDGSDCDHDDEVCVHMDELHATAADANAARLVPWLDAERERLLKICGEAGDFELDIAEELGLPAGTSRDDLIAALSRLTRERDEAREHLDKVRRGLRTPDGWATKIHAVYVRQQRDKARDLLGAIWLHVPWRSITRHLTTEQRELWADAVEVAGDPDVKVAADRWWRDDAPVSDSDTTEDGDRVWRVGDDPGADRALMLDAAEYVINGRHASVSAVQRNIRVGSAKAGQLMDLLETWGVVGPADGSMARKVLMPKEQLHGLIEAIRGGVK